MTPGGSGLSAETRIRRARESMLLTVPFWAVLSLKLRLVEDSTRTETMSTDGTRLFYNPAWVAGLSDAELRGVVAHETAHCALGHPWRRDGRDPEDWDQATDAVVNPMVLGTPGLGTLPPGGIVWDWVTRDMSAENVFARMPHTPKAKAPDASPGDGEDSSGSTTGQPDDAPSDAPQGAPGTMPGDSGQGWGAVEDAPPEVAPGAPGDLTPEDWTMAVAQAGAMAGDDAGGLGRAVAVGGRLGVDWRDALREFVARCTPSDYSWAKLSRRSVGASVWLPGQSKDGTGGLGVCVDTSGSINDRMLASIRAELIELVREMAPECVMTIYCDSRVQLRGDGSGEIAEDVWGQGDDPDGLTWSPRGGGGTAFQPGIDELGRMYAEGSVLAGIYISADMDAIDLGGLTNPGGMPVLWICSETACDGRRAPFGDRVVWEDRDRG